MITCTPFTCVQYDNFRIHIDTPLTSYNTYPRYYQYLTAGNWNDKPLKQVIMMVNEEIQTMGEKTVI